LAEVVALTNLIQTAYALHNADVIKSSAWAYHNAQDTTHALADATAVTTLQGAITKLNDIKSKYNAHELETTGHASEGTVTADQIAAANAAYGATVKVSDSGVAADDLIYWAILDDGTGNVTGVGATAYDGYIVFEFSADPQNDAIISWEAIRL
jgi:hypothetical protein